MIIAQNYHQRSRGHMRLIKAFQLKQRYRDVRCSESDDSTARRGMAWRVCDRWNSILCGKKLLNLALAGAQNFTGNIKAYMDGKILSSQTDLFLFPILLANSVYERYRRFGERCVHRIIPADSSSCDGTTRFQALQILSKNMKTDIDCYACFPFTIEYHFVNDTFKIFFYRLRDKSTENCVLSL